MKDSGPILVALDGSDLSEAVLPYTRALADAFGERIALVTVWEGTDNSLGATMPDVIIDIEKSASAHFNAYLDEAAAKLPGADVEKHVRTGDPGQAILEVAREIGARAVAISTHGRSGIGRWLYGSTASHLLRHADVPLIVCGPNVLKKTPGDVTLKHIMLPLDGSELSEAAIPLAEGLAKRVGARVSLVRGLPWAAQAYPFTLPNTYVPRVDDEIEMGARAYLRKQEEKLTEVEVSAFIVRGAVADGLIGFVEQQHVDIVLMTTHARRGLARAALGSTADRMLQAPAPVILLRPEIVS
jgi:nucleotide-binding universal stress UspA family protein